MSKLSKYIKSLNLNSLRPQISRRTLVVSIALIVIFSAALLLRIMPAKYGYYLNEYDPFFDYYASKFLVDHFDAQGIRGFADYFTWQDYRTWFPEGRPVARTSQVGLHFAGAIFYIIARNIFGLSASLYDFVVMFPPMVGALSIFPIYLIARRVTSPGGSLLAALIVAFSGSVIQRGNLGWFKSEPFALFLALWGAYFFLTVFDPDRKFNSLVGRSLASGLLLGLANTAWGGSLFFAIVISAVFIIMPFLNINQSKAIFSGAIFVSMYLLISALSPRPGVAIINGPIGLALLGSLGFAILSYIIRSYAVLKEYNTIITNVIIGSALSGIIILSFGFLSGVSGRYLTVVLPFQRSGVPLVESVAEHFVPTGAQYFSEYLILLPLAFFGILKLFNKRNIDSVFLLAFAGAGIYISSSFSRLLIYSTLSIAILAAIGFAALTRSMFKPMLTGFGKRKTGGSEIRVGLKVFYSVVMIALLCFPVITPSYSFNSIFQADIPTAIANSGSTQRAFQGDFLEALAWMQANTDEDAVIAAWWDYGYWITVMGNRTSLADNATINGTRIEVLGRMFMSPQAESLEILDSLDADYVLIFIAGRKGNDQRIGEFYLLGGGGDESKKQWFIRIGGFEDAQFVEADGFTPNDNLWANSMLGKLMPFVTNAQVSQDGQLVENQPWQQGMTTIYKYEMKYPASSNGPLRLAFASSSIQPDAPDGAFTGVLIYEIVKDQSELEEPEEPELAVPEEPVLAAPSP